MSEIIDAAIKGMVDDTMAEKNLRVSIQKLENAMVENVESQVELENTHYFADGIYAREIFIPAGTCLTGKIHRTEHINIISQGDITVITEDGEKRIQAPCTIVSRPGTKRAGFAHTDTVWTTIHAAKSRDLEELERILIAPTHADLLEGEQ